MNPTDPEAIFAAWAEQADRGEAPDFAVIIASHPQLAAPLQAMHRDWQLFAPILERVVPGLIASDAGAARDAPFLSADDTAAENLPSPDLIERLGVTLPDAGRYGFRGVLGRGGGGVVLRVWDHKLRRSLAMKVVLGLGEHDPATGTPPVDAAVMTRFVDEARIASQLDHPGIVPVHELGTDATGRAFFTMRLVKGDDLSKVFAKVRNGIDGWTQVRALGVLAKVCDAVAYAHGKGVVHRDLKPANVMVGRHGEVHVMDWGLARVHEALRVAEMPRATDSHVQTLRAAERGETPDSPLLTAAGSVLGTPVYMAPEQARGDLDRVGLHSDVYAIGAMLYELLAGSPPFMPRDANIDPRTVVLRVLEGPPQSLTRLAPRAPLELVAICERAMAREPKQRYSDVRAFGEDLAAYLENRVVRAHAQGAWIEAKKWIQRNRGLAGAIASALVFLVGGAIGTTWFALDADEKAESARQRSTELERAAYAATVFGGSQALAAERFSRVDDRLAECPEHLRGWEWRWLVAQDASSWVLKSERAITSGHFDASGEAMFLVDDDGVAWHHDLRTDQRTNLGRATSQGEGSYDGAAMSADRRYWLTGNDAAPIRVWSTATRAVVREFEGTAEYMELAGGAPRVLARHGDTVAVWSLPGGERLCTLDVELDSSYRANLSADGRLVAAMSRSGDGELALWDVATGERLMRLASPGFRSARFAPDSRRVIVSGEEGVQLFDTTTLEHTSTFETRLDCDFWFDPDGRHLVGRGVTHTVRWELATGREVGRVAPLGYFDDLQQAGPPGVILYVPHSALTLLDARSLRRLATYPGHDPYAWVTDFHQPTQRVATASNDGDVRIWDLADPLLPSPSWHWQDARQPWVSTDGSRLAICHESDQTRCSVWELTTKRRLCTLVGHSGFVDSIELSRDGRHALTLGDDTVRVWDARSGRQLAKLEFDNLWGSARFRNDGRAIVTWTWNSRRGSTWSEHVLADFGVAGGGSVRSPHGGRMQVRPSENGRFRFLGRGLRDGLTGAEVEFENRDLSAFWSADERYLAISMRDEPNRSGRLFDLDAWAWTVEFESTEDHHAFWQIGEFSPGGDVLARACKDWVYVWDVATGKLLWRERHDSNVSGVAFHPDGERLATGCVNGTVHLWTAREGHPLAEIRCDDASSEASPVVGFDPRGELLVTSMSDGRVRIDHSTPFRARYPLVLAARRAFAKMNERVTPLLERGDDPLVVREAMLADPGLDDLHKTQAMAAVEEWTAARSK